MRKPIQNSTDRFAFRDFAREGPAAIVGEAIRKTIEEDVIRSLVPDFYDRAIRQAGIMPVLVEIPPLERVKVKKDTPFSFTATVEIKPTIELRDYKAPNPISLKQDQRTVTDEQVQKALEVPSRTDGPIASCSSRGSLGRRRLRRLRH